jgi:hypothetical protein
MTDQDSRARRRERSVAPKNSLPLFELMMGYQKLKIVIRLMIHARLLRRDR